MKRPPIRILDAAGSPGDIGRLHGSTYADDIKVYTADRVALVAAGSWSGGPMATGEVLEIAESMLPAHEAFDADLHTEMTAMADAAGISHAEAVIVGGFTDFVDTVRAVMGGDVPTSVVEDDCTAVLIPDGRAAGQGFLGQTWDMHDTATDHVLLLRLTPDDAPPAVVFTTTGCLGQIGMNANGVAVGINNLTGLDGTRGVAWTSVVRGMLKTSSADEALTMLLDANLAGAHNFLILDRNGVGYNVEAMPSVRPVAKLEDTPIAHTNHTVDPDASAVQAPKDTGLLSNSTERLDRATELLAEGPVDAERLFELTRDPGAICRVSDDEYHIESSGAAVMRPATGDFWACWGLPSHNPYQHVPFPGDEVADA